MIIGTFYSVFRSYVTSLKINLMQSRCRVLVKLHSPGGWWTHLSRTTGILTLSALCVRGCISVTSWNHFQSAGMSILVVLTIFLPLSLVLSVCSLFFYVISGENHGKFWNLICMFEYLDYDFLFFNSKLCKSFAVSRHNLQDFHWFYRLWCGSTWVKYKYFFIFASTSSSTQSTWRHQVHQVLFHSSTRPSTLVTNNNTVSLDPKLISAVTVVKFQFHSYGLQFQCQYFQFHQFQFQFQFWNRNWAAFPILELNWPQSCMQWLGNELVTSQYLNLWWPELCLHMVSPALNRLRYLLSLHW